MAHPNQQLQLRFPFRAPSPRSCGLIREKLSLIQIGAIDISCYSEESFPSSWTLHTLKLRNCEKLTQLGDYENLEVLEVINCPLLLHVGTVDKIVVLKLQYKVSTLPLLFFPLETIVHLEISRPTQVLLHLHRFHSLEYLKVIPCPFEGHSDQFPRLPIPTLLDLVLNGFQSIDVTGLVDLLRLDVGSAEKVVGKEEIYPQLKSLKGFQNAFIHDDMRNYPKLRTFSWSNIPEEALPNMKHCRNIQEVELLPCSLYQPAKSFCIGEKVVKFNINHVSRFKGIEPGRSFTKICLNEYYSGDISFCENVSQLYLWNCTEIVSVQCVKNVPYLYITGCARISDFSCLGSQRYLVIDNCQGLCDADTQNFGKILSLEIVNCYHIFRLLNLTHNRFLQLCNCGKLIEVRLTGHDYVKVRIGSCSLLTELNISGKVYQLSIHHCLKLDKNNLRNYGILDCGAPGNEQFEDWDNLFC
jgi:hypothetical protein